MADYDRRDNYRGGGGGRGYNKRKRNRDEDDEDDQGGYRGGGGGGFRNQRRRQDPPPGTRLRLGLLEMAEDHGRLAHDVALHLAKLAAQNYDDFVKETFYTVTLKLVVEQPFKIPFVAATVLYANAQKEEIGQHVLENATPKLQEYLAKGQWREVKLMLRFFACCSPLFSEDGVMPILDELFNRAADLQTESPDDTLGPELIKIILLTIPYLVAATEDASLQEKVSELLAKTEIIASSPQELNALVQPYPSNGEDDSMACPSTISLLQFQLQEEAKNGWPLSCIPRPYKPELNAQNGADGEVEVAEEAKVLVRHGFPVVEVPVTVSPGSRIPFPELFFSVFADQEIESVPTTSNIASCVIRDAILDTMNILDFNRNVAAKLMNEIDCFWAPDTFIKRATQFDKLKDVPEGKSTWKPEDIVVDSIFSQIFQLPTPEHRLVYYHSLVTESCRISPGAIAPSLGRAIRFLYRNVDLMDMELRYRFQDWFAHHLSNFEFRWKWTEWLPEVDEPDIAPKKAFIIGTLDKEIRLGFAKRVRDTLPEPFHPLVPEGKDREIPPFKYKDDKTPYAEEGREVLSLLKKKAPDEEIQTILDRVQEQAVERGVEDPLVPIVDIYMTAILSTGAKSLSHVLATVDRCRDRLLDTVRQSEAARRQIITAVFDFWADHPGTAVNIADKLLNYTIVTPMSVIVWGLHDRLDRGRSLASGQIYELIATTMHKVTTRVRQVKNERENLNIPYEQRKQVDEALPAEREGMRALFQSIEDYVAPVASGSQDEMVERFEGNEQEMALIKDWGERWLKVWRRKAAVEEALVGESAIGELLDPVEEIQQDDGIDAAVPVEMDVAA